jgi:hypothetical protein
MSVELVAAAGLCAWAKLAAARVSPQAAMTLLMVLKVIIEIS